MMLVWINLIVGNTEVVVKFEMYFKEPAYFAGRFKVDRIKGERNQGQFCGFEPQQQNILGLPSPETWKSVSGVGFQGYGCGNTSLIPTFWIFCFCLRQSLIDIQVGVC